MPHEPGNFVGRQGFDGPTKLHDFGIGITSSSFACCIDDRPKSIDIQIFVVRYCLAIARSQWR